MRKPSSALNLPYMANKKTKEPTAVSSADTFLDVVFENFKTKIAPFKFCRTAANLVDRQQCKVDGGFLKRCLASKWPTKLEIYPCAKGRWPSLFYVTKWAGPVQRLEARSIAYIIIPLKNSTITPECKEFVWFSLWEKASKNKKSDLHNFSENHFLRF